MGLTAESGSARQNSHAQFGRSIIHNRQMVLGLAAAIVSGNVAVPVVRFISLKLVRGSPLCCGLVANLGHWAAMAVLRIKAVIDLTLKVALGVFRDRSTAVASKRALGCCRKPRIRTTRNAKT